MVRMRIVNHGMLMDKILSTNFFLLIMMIGPTRMMRVMAMTISMGKGDSLQIQNPVQKVSGVFSAFPYGMLADAPLPSYFCLGWITPIHQHWPPMLLVVLVHFTYPPIQRCQPTQDCQSKHIGFTTHSNVPDQYDQSNRPTCFSILRSVATPT